MKHLLKDTRNVLLILSRKKTACAFLSLKTDDSSELQFRCVFMDRGGFFMQTPEKHIHRLKRKRKYQNF
ncbi:hypothetical protein HZS_8027 [Henneguya salminicola]|nr:hypothetical protein HZS_8027 [Henneguya salminicola]